MKKRIIFYEANPLYYKDSNNDGIGDLKGMTTQISYFTHLGIDALIIPNILSIYSKTNSNNDYKSIIPEIGTIDDFIVFSKKMKAAKIKIIIDINIGSIKETHKWFKEASKDKDEFNNIIVGPKVDVYGDVLVNDKDNKSVKDETKLNTNTNTFYFVNQKTSEVSLNWKTGKIREMFLDVARYWNKLGVSGFRFSNFEYIGQTKAVNKLEEHTTLLELRRFYRSLKDMNQNFIIIGRSEIVSPKESNILLAKNTKVLDYFQPLNYSKVGLSEKYENDVIGKFSPKKLINLIKSYTKSNESILSFGTNITGRPISRWGGNNQYNVEVTKSLALIQLFYNASPLIYYGEEIGAKNMGLTYLDDFQDQTLYERKRKLQTENIKVQDFMAAQVLQNPINSHTLMAWTAKKNGGFSRYNHPIVPASYSYKDINVMSQYTSNSAPLNFYRRIIQFIKNDEIKEVINDGTSNVKISLFGKGVIQISHKCFKKEIIIMSNFSEKSKKIKQSDDFKVILSSYFNKDYKRPINMLLEYETIVMVKNIETKVIDDFPSLTSKKPENKEVKIDAKKSSSKTTPLINTKEIVNKIKSSDNNSVSGLLGKWSPKNKHDIKEFKVKDDNKNKVTKSKTTNESNSNKKKTLKEKKIESTIEMARKINMKYDKEKNNQDNDSISQTIEMITNDIEETQEMNFDDNLLNSNPNNSKSTKEEIIDEGIKILKDGVKDMVYHEKDFLEIERKQSVNHDDKNHNTYIKK